MRGNEISGRSNILVRNENHGCLGHDGAIRITVAQSVRIFVRTLWRAGIGGKA